jgi:hypothetical protein
MFSARGARTVVLAAVGVVLLWISIQLAHSRREFLRDAVGVPGVVSQLNAGGSHPQISFTTRDGRRVSVPQGGFIFGFHTGDAVRVLYRAGNPEGTACVDRAGALWFAPGFSAALGLLFLVAAIHSMVRSFRGIE